MQKFTTKIVSLMKAENLFQTQGGPIILSQVNKEIISKYNLSYFGLTILYYKVYDVGNYNNI
jgi:hypothetical protein